MIKYRVFIIVLYFFVLIVFPGISVLSGTFDEALKLAKEQNKKVIVDVYTDWCGWCKKMDRDAYSNNDVKDLIDEDFVYVKLDAESSSMNTYKGKSFSGADLASYFQVTGYPTHVFLEPDGTLIEFNYNKYKMNNIPGYFNASDFKKILEFIKEEKYKDTDLSMIL
jgi:thioredoxin-related protein